MGVIPHQKPDPVTGHSHFETVDCFCDIGADHDEHGTIYRERD